MQRQAKKTVLTVVRPTHVDLFVEYYDELRRWAVKFTEGDHERAEDLLHDLFIHFTLAKPDLELIQNLESYLYVVMRNLHLSQVRRATRAPLRSLSAVEYDTADVSLWWSDPRDRLKMRDELVTICQYACFRRQSSKAGSVLILRFFHGYYPEEIALVLRSSRSAVDNRLLSARAEVRTYLTDPAKVSFIDGGPTQPSESSAGRIGDDLMAGLRRQIFQSKQGECITNKELNEIYAADASGPSRNALAHIVACEKCLDEVNDMLEIPRLATRYPLDTVGKDPGNKDGDGGTGGGTGGGSGGGKMLDKYLLRRDAIYHHRPEELCVSVNGHMQSFQKISAAKSELTLVIDMFENLGFVEVFSEQGLRLLLLNVEPPPSGEARQSCAIELSNGRKIEANLSFGGPFPTLQVSYNDPTADPDVLADIAADVSVPPAVAGRDFAAETPRHGENDTLLDGLKFWLQPARITAAFAVLITAVAGFLYFTRPVETPVTAAAILSNATRNEVDIANRPDLAVRSSYRVEEYSNGTLVAKRRVDQWQKSDASSRRVFDDKDKMIAGEWRGKDGKSQVFEQGQKLRSVQSGDAQSVPQGGRVLSVPSAVADGDLFAGIENPSAKQFASLIEKAGVSEQLKLQESTDLLTIKYEGGGSGSALSVPPAIAGGLTQAGDDNDLPNQLLVASLTLDRKSLQPRSETLVLRIGDETREYRFTDIHVEQKPVDEVSPLIFLPEAELLQGATKVEEPIEIEPVATAAETNINTNTTVLTPATATLETEVEVFKLLDSINALSGEQITVTRTAGQLKVSGVVDSLQRKNEIVGALAPVRSGRGVIVDIQTVEEAAKKRAAAAKQSNTTVSIESVTVATDQSLPVETELRSLLSRRGVAPDRMADEMRAFSNTVTASSRVLRRNALALKQIAERFTNEEIERLEPAKRDEWKALVRSRGRAVAGDIRALTTQLSALLPGSNVGAGTAADLKNAEDAATAAQRLFGLAAAADSQVSQSFAISSGARGDAPVRSVQFWRSLAQMAGLAAELQRF